MSITLNSNQTYSNHPVFSAVEKYADSEVNLWVYDECGSLVVSCRDGDDESEVILSMTQLKELSAELNEWIKNNEHLED